MSQKVPYTDLVMRSLWNLRNLSNFYLSSRNSSSAKSSTSRYVERKKDDEIRFEHCLKCGAHNPILIKGGKNTSGKQLYRCKECGRRFTCNHGSVTFSNKLSEEVWMETLSLVLRGATLTEMEEWLNVSRVMAHSMRHKILNALKRQGTGRNSHESSNWTRNMY